MGANQSREGDECREGDHIYIWRTWYSYGHHGIYVGKNKVVHFTNPADGSGKSSVSAQSSAPNQSCSHSYCGTKQPGSGVVMSCLNCFLESDKLCLYRYGLKVWEYIRRSIRDGTCTTAQSDPPEEVIHRAMYLWQNNVFGDWNVFTRNCEDFALYCKTGRWISTGISNQVNIIDLGFRRYVPKVNVEDFPIS